MSSPLHPWCMWLCLPSLKTTKTDGVSAKNDICSLHLSLLLSTIITAICKVSISPFKQFQMFAVATVVLLISCSLLTHSSTPSLLCTSIPLTFSRVLAHSSAHTGGHRCRVVVSNICLLACVSLCADHNIFDEANQPCHHCSGNSVGTNTRTNKHYLMLVMMSSVFAFVRFHTAVCYDNATSICYRCLL